MIGRNAPRPIQELRWVRLNQAGGTGRGIMRGPAGPGHSRILGLFSSPVVPQGVVDRVVVLSRKRNCQACGQSS